MVVVASLGAKIVAVDINEEQLALARSLGAYATVNAKENLNVVQEIRDLTEGGAHVSIDALGSEATCFNSISNLRKRGKHIQVGLMTGSQSHVNISMSRVIAHELEIIGSHGMQAFKYPEMLLMIENGKLQPEKLIGRTISLENAATKLPLMNTFEGTGVTVINSF